MIVRSIYDLYLHGKGSRKIKDYLESEGFKTVKGNSTWNKSTILDILKNEKYTGDALLQKTYKPSFKSKQRVKNTGQVQQYFVQNSHPAIITREQFQKVHEIMHERARLYTKIHKRDPKEIYSKRSPYAGLVKCGYCGKSYRVKTRPRYKSDEVTKFLQCSSNENKKVCPAKNIRIDEFEKKVINQINYIILNKEIFLNEQKNSLFTSVEYTMILDKINLLNRESKNIEKRIEMLEVDRTTLNDVAIKELQVRKLDIEMIITSYQNVIKITFNFNQKLKHFENILSKYKNSIKYLSTFPINDFVNKIELKSNSIVFRY